MHVHDPIDDDHQLEAYLRSFSPLAPDPLPKRARQPWMVFTFSGAAAAAVAAAVLLIVPHFRRAPVTPEEELSITLGSADAMLTKAASWDAAIDDPGFAFRPSLKRMDPARRSALEFLGQENLTP
jgi:hypothetical protein